MTKKNEQFGDDYRDDDHKRDDGNDDHYVHVDGKLDSSAFKADGTMYFGAGNSPDNYEIADNRAEHLEIGLKVHERHGADSPVVSDIHNVAHHNEDAGLEAGSTNRATWNFDYDVNTLLGGGHGKIDQFDFKMTISDDNAAKGIHHTEVFDLHPTVVAGGFTFHNVWVSETDPSHHFGGSDDQVPASLVGSQAQNSVNVGFEAFDGGGAHGFGSLADRTSAGTTWDVKLSAYEHHELVAQVHDVINLVPDDHHVVAPVVTVEHPFFG